MKKILAASLFLMAMAPALALAYGYDDYGEKIQSSYSDVATGGPVLFASGTVQFVGITISSPAPLGYIAFYRSTSTTFTSEIATQTKVDCSYQSVNTGPDFVPLFGMENTSYSYVSRFGACNATIWFTWPDPTTANTATTGLGYFGTTTR